MTLPKLVIFDWDGTLVDSIEPILRGFELSYGRFGHPCPSAVQLRATIGLPLALAFEQLTPDLPSAVLTAMYRDYWFDPQRPPSPWARGALELLDWLDGLGIALAIATGKSRRGLDHELEALGVGHRFVTTRSADDAQPKPHPDMVHQILEQQIVSPSQAVLVGDSPLDLSMGRAAGVVTYGVLGGVGSLEDLRQQQPRHVLSVLAELKGALKAEGAFDLYP